MGPPLAEPLEEMLDQRRNVRLALAQRRNRQVDDVEAIEQVLAELPLVDEMPQAPVGGGDDPDVDRRPRPLGADLLQLAGLEEAQQHALHPQRHLADFVEEHGALVRHLELAGLVAIRPGEAALDVAEELRLEQRLGQAGAVHGDEVVVLPRPFHVDGPGHDFLADAALAGDQDLGVGLGHAQDFLPQLRQERTVTHQQRKLTNLDSHAHAH